ncbi:MAG: LPXTG cell wall anchor domain-containing protein [Oscillospiraceae bacterium]|nr:LPXTG cell wall anchor domain-containing protein [Oscillospiraceae bacterium]
MKASQITASVFVVCLLSFSLFAEGTLTAEAYAPLKAEIPVFCQAVPGADTQIYQIAITPDASAPVPASGSISVTENSGGVFEIGITEPGTYRYQISETAGSDDSITYDGRVYEVTVFVENGAADTLVYAVTANEAGDAEKADQIRFENAAEAETASVTETETTTETTATTDTTETTETTETTAVTTTAEEHTNPIISIINHITTGDDFPVIALLLGLTASLGAAAAAFLFRRKTREKEGGK